MAIFPKIESPCPYIDQFDAIMDGDRCKMCEKDVHDLSGMNDDEKRAFFAACEGDVCVSYTLPLKHAIAAAALMGSGLLASGAAQAAPLQVIVGGTPSASPAYLMVGGKTADQSQVIDVPVETTGETGPETAHDGTEPEDTTADEVTLHDFDPKLQIAGGIRAYNPADYVDLVIEDETGGSLEDNADDD